VTWCGPCASEIPHFIELQKQYKEQGFEMVGIALDRQGKEAVAPFAEEHCWAILNYPDGQKNATLHGQT